MDPRLIDYLASIGASPESLNGWEISTAQRAGHDVAFVITRHAEIHFVSIVGKRAMSRRNIVEFVQPLLDKFGYAMTRVPLAETDHKLREALGFMPTWRDDDYQYFALSALPYQKGLTPCPSL
jgi:hypothetical protein